MASPRRPIAAAGAWSPNLALEPRADRRAGDTPACPRPVGAEVAE